MAEQKEGWSRRHFLEASALGAVGLAVLPGITGFAAPAVEKEIALGFIGLGQQANFLLNGFMQLPGVKVVAGCDVYGIKRKRFQKKVTAFYLKSGK
jgi:hypothetical protein